MDHPKAYEYLIRHGKLITLRKYPYREGQRIRIYHDGKYIGVAVVVFVAPTESLVFLKNEEMNKVVELTGFSSLEEWLEAAKKLHKMKSVPPYVVGIKLVKKVDGI